MNNRCYTLSLKCTSSEGSLYAISTDEFHIHMKRDEIAWKKLQELQNMGDEQTINKIVKNSKYLRKIRKVEKSGGESKMNKYKNIIKSNDM